MLSVRLNLSYKVIIFFTFSIFVGRSGRALPPGKPTLKYDPDNLDPDTVTIKWDPPVYNGGSKITGYLVEHKRTGSPHWVKASPIKVTHTQLTVCGLEPGWRYQFRVTAENEFGLSDPSPLSEPLAIFVHRSAAIAPYFITELNDLVVLENEKKMVGFILESMAESKKYEVVWKVEFTVTFEGIPIPKISWYKDGLEVFSNRCQKVSTEGCTSSLLIYEAAISDESEIKCSATNRVGYAVTRAYLKVEAPPTIRLPRQYEDGVIFEHGETVRLKVSAVGQPMPSITWFFNGTEITPSIKYEMEYQDKTASLKIKNTERGDRGEYQIQASNVLGEDVASILVTIANRPQPPINLTIERIFGSSVTLSWSPPEDDGGCKIGTYIIEYYRTCWNVWLKATSSRQPRIALDNLIEGSEYKFRVKAENPYGISDPSPETDIVFIPDPKRGIFDPAHISHEVSDNILELEVPQMNPYLNRLSPIPDRLGIDAITGIVGYSGDSPTETDGSSENLDRKKYAPLKPARKHKKMTKLDHSTINVDLLNLPEDDYYSYVHYSKNNFNSLNVDRTQTPSPQPSISADDTSQTSSELMLVLVPSAEDVRNPRANSLTRDYKLAKYDHCSINTRPPPISLSAPELGSEIEFFKPLQRNCVSSTEILHESTIARFYKELNDEDAASKFKEKFSILEVPPLVDNFAETSQLLVNRSRKNRAKMYSNDVGPEVVSDLRKIEHQKLIENQMKPEIRLNEISIDTNPRRNLHEKTGTIRRTKCLQKSESLDRSTSPTNVIHIQPTSIQTNSILTVEPHPQGRYSPRSGTFHYPDLFMESLTKSPKFKTTSGSLTEVVAELLARKARALNSAAVSQNSASTSRSKESLLQNENDGLSITRNRSPMLVTRNLGNKNDRHNWENDFGEDEDLDKVEIDEELDESDDDYDELENEADTYHPSVYAPLSFEEALAISNPKRSISPTNDLFLESETPFYEDDVEPDYGLHYFNRNYADVDTGKPTVVGVEEKQPVLKPILKHSSYEEPSGGGLTVPNECQEYFHASIRRRDSRSPKKHVRIEEPNKEPDEFQPRTEEANPSLVIVNHYSDIVEQFGKQQKSPVKVYTTYEELRAAAEEAESENMLETNVEGDEYLATETDLGADIKDHFENMQTSYTAASLIQDADKTEIVKKRVHFLFDFCLDFFMFLFACWLYFFKDERLAIPIILLMVYRQLCDKIKTKTRKSLEKN